MRSINCMQFGMPQSITDVYFFLNVGMFFFILTFCNNWPGSRIKHKWWLVVFSRNFKTCQHHKINCLEFNRTAAVFFISRQPTSWTNRWRNKKDNSSSRACNSVSSLQIFVWLASMIPTLSCIVTVSFKAQWFACTKYQIRTNIHGDLSCIETWSWSHYLNWCCLCLSFQLVFVFAQVHYKWTGIIWTFQMFS